MNLLLIEDDDRIAEFLIRGLKAEGHHIARSENGLEGYAKARNQLWDAIILDLMLPGMDGREICRQLRMEKVFTKILMLTALETTQDVVQGLRMGADDYLTKPFAFDELLARLEVFARNQQYHHPSPNPVMVAGALAFDTEGLSATFHGERLDLTSLEYALLEFLMVERGKVVSRARI